MNSIEILNPGLLTTVQDKGRWGYQQYGMPVSGAMDEFSYRIANKLVNNKEGAACLEITMLGPAIKFNQKTYFAVTGADIEIFLNENKINNWSFQVAHKGDLLRFGHLNCGTRAYLAICGGITTPEVMGSRSTYLRGAIGGHKGRQLKKGDILPIGKRKMIIRKPRFSKSNIPQWCSSAEIRVIKGVDYNEFTEESIKTLEEQVYTLDSNSDRMGFRLQGIKLQHKSGPDVLSYGISKGAIQVPGDGLPIIMMSDRQTTGGYTQIANIITADLPIVAQLKPGDHIKFKFVRCKKAIKALKRQNKI